MLCVFARLCVCASELCAYELLRDLDESYGCDCGFRSKQKRMAFLWNEKIRENSGEKEQIMSYRVDLSL